MVQQLPSCIPIPMLFPLVEVRTKLPCDVIVNIRPRLIAVDTVGVALAELNDRSVQLVAMPQQKKTIASSYRS